MDQGFDRQTYYFQKIFANQAMLRKDWYYGTDWYETWLSYEQPDQTQSLENAWANCRGSNDEPMRP
jgi:hypothetical protein